MIDATFINAIDELAVAAATPKIIEVDGRTYSTRSLTLISEPKVPEPAALVVHTLTGLADYVRHNRDALDFSEYVLHVVDAGRVDLVSKVRGEQQQRFRHVSAQNYDRFASVPTFGFGKYLSLEDMTIGLQALFAGGGHLAEVLRLIGSVKSEGSVQTEDDGVSQKVTARSGIALVQNVAVPNPVILTPYRTFPDIGEQPSGPFVFRLKKHGEEVRAALYEADGGAWRNVAIASVADWLRAELPEIAILA